MKFQSSLNRNTHFEKQAIIYKRELDNREKYRMAPARKHYNINVRKSKTY